MRFVKRTLSAFLALVMVFTMLPLQVWASETQQSANDSVNFSSIVADGAGDDRALEPDGNDVDTYIFKIDDKVVSTQYVKNGEEVYAPEAPAKEGYKFVGWFEGETQFVAGSAKVDEGNIQHTYIACYQQVYYVFFMDGIGANAAVVHTQEGVTGTVIDTAFTFNAGPDSGVEGWYYDRELTQKVQPDETIQDQNITLYPKVEQGHWLRFDANGGTPVASQFVLPSDKTTEPAAPTREGYDFDGWYNGDAKFEFSKPLNESATLTAQWQGKQVKYKVFYWVENADDDGYSLVNSVEKTGTAGDPSVNPGDTLELPRDYPDKNLANAVHYNAEKTGNEAEKTIAGDGSTIVNVYYDRNEYTLYFYQQGGGRGELICHEEEHTHGIGCYQWVGYLKLTCKKAEHTHTAACYKQSSDNYAADPITGKYGASLAKMGAEWPSNTVNGRNWSTKADGSAPWQANIETIPAQNTSFWVPDSPGWNSYDQTAYYYVEVLGNEKTDTYVGSKYYKMYDEVTVKSGYLTVSAEDRYEIQGFTLNKSDSTKVNDKYDNARFYYTRNNYTLTLVNGGSQEVKSLQYEAPLRPHLGEPAKPSGMGENFTFQGWYRDENFNEKFEYNDKTTMPANSLTLYAKWAAPEITVTVHTGTGTDSGTQEIKVPYGGKIDPQDLPNIMLPDGIDTYNWATYRDGKYLSFDLDTPLYQDVTIYPYWVSNERFSVTYVLGENVQGEVIDSKRYWGNADADIQGLPKGFKHPEGKVFLGWKADREGDDNLYQPGDKIQIQNADVILKAQWGNVAQKTRLTYHANDGTTKAKSFEYYNNQDVKLASADELHFTWEGHRFLGWAEAADAEGIDFTAGQTIRVNNDNPTGNTLYAVWEAVSAGYTVEYWFQNADNDDYEHWEKLDVPGTGNIGTQTDAQPLAETPEGFHHNSNKTVNVEITADGNAVAEVYYDRNVHNVVYKITGEYFANDNYHKDEGIRFGAELPAAPENMDKAGYVWSGWSKLPETMPDTDVVVTGSYSLQTGLPYTVNYIWNGTVLKTVRGTGTFGDPVDPEVKSFDGYTFKEKDKDFTITADAAQNVVNVYYYKNVTLTAKNKVLTYNGETQTAEPGYVSSETNAVFEGIVPTGRGKDAKEYPIAFPKNTLNTVDETELYIVADVKDGTLTINKRQVALESESGEQVYNGTALTNNNVSVSGDGFVKGDVTEVKATGTQTLVGESKNTIEIDWSSDALAKNYAITEDLGTLTVTAPDDLNDYVAKTHAEQNFKVGDKVTFNISVTNIYAVNAKVTLEEMAGMFFGENQTTLKDVLNPGETKTYTATRTLTDADFEAGGVNNEVTVTLTPEGGDPTDGTDTDNVVLVKNPDMSVVKTVLNPKESYRVGDTIQYQITVTNTGNVTLHDLELTDVMNADGKVTFPAGTDLTRKTLNVGDRWTVTCSYVVRAADEGKTISNTAKVISRDDDGNPNKDGEDTTPGESVQKRYSLTIHYRNGAGNAVAGSYSARYHVGDSFKIVSPIVAGYYDPQTRSISSGANGMPAQDLEYVVIYTAIPVPAPDPGPGPAPNPGPGPGPAPNPGPDDGDDDDDTPPVPNPEQEQPPQPQDFEIDPDDYTLTELEDNETPLANLDLEGHTCCILHLLLMLAAMVVLGFDTKSRKKHQARIFELKKMLAMEEDHSDDPEQP